MVSGRRYKILVGARLVDVVKSQLWSSHRPITFSHQHFRPLTMHFFTSLAAFAVLATGAYAQTQAQIQDCANSLKTVNCETYSTYSTSDTTLYSISYSYNTTLCTDPLIPVNRLYLTDQDANLQYSCTT